MKAARRPGRGIAVRSYAQRLRIKAPPECVFDAVTTLKGLRGWWTSRVSGSPAAQGGDVRFEFEGLDEYIVMRVDGAERPTSVLWTCVVHTGLDDWNGTQVRFQVEACKDGECELAFEHVGLTPKLDCYEDCEAGWGHFLSSLVTYVERGKGTPFCK